MKYSEDIVPISSLKINPGRVVKQIDKAHRPVLLTRRDPGGAVVVEALRDYEARGEEQGFLRGGVEGLIDLKEGREISLTDVKKNALDGANRMPRRRALAFAGSAVGDLDEICAWHVEQQVPGVGEKFLGEIVSRSKDCQISSLFIAPG